MVKSKLKKYTTYVGLGDHPKWSFVPLFILLAIVSGKNCCTKYICDVCQFLHNWSNQWGISYNNDPDSYFPSTDPLFGSFFRTRWLLGFSNVHFSIRFFRLVVHLTWHSEKSWKSHFKQRLNATHVLLYAMQY